MGKTGKCDSCEKINKLYKNLDKYFCKKCQRSLKKTQRKVINEHPEIANDPEKITEKMREKLLEENK